MDLNERELAGEIGSRLAKIRLSRNIKQDTLAESAGINVRTLRRIEAGHPSTIESFLRVAMAPELEDTCSRRFPRTGGWLPGRVKFAHVGSARSCFSGRTPTHTRRRGGMAVEALSQAGVSDRRRNGSGLPLVPSGEHGLRHVCRRAGVPRC